MKNFFLILFLFTTSAEIFSQPIKGKSGQELLAVLDDNTNLGSGLIKGNLTIIKRTGDKVTWKLNVFRRREDSLWIFIREKGDVEAKFLFKDSGDKVYHYNALSSKLFLKNEEEKYNTFLTTGFGYMEISGYSYQASYNPTIEPSKKKEEEGLVRVVLKPIISYNFKKLVAFFKDKGTKTEKLDFFDKNDHLFKILYFREGVVRVGKNHKITEVPFLSRYEMFDVMTETISIIDFYEIDRDVLPDSSLFDVANIHK
ncbi:MAG: outer membrane lipoprotein-sorting protein [Leptospiraceae bacterium]|nr:outer membrane lipoprotein-sorting protein [Leptospiraceae bacterium]